MQQLKKKKKQKIHIRLKLKNHAHIDIYNTTTTYKRNTCRNLNRNYKQLIATLSMKTSPQTLNKVTSFLHMYTHIQNTHTHTAVPTVGTVLDPSTVAAAALTVRAPELSC